MKECSKFWFRVYLCDVVFLGDAGVVPQRPQRMRAPAARAQCRAIESIDGDEIEERFRRAEYIMVLAIGFNQAAM